jgi:hypothetical protein
VSVHIFYGYAKRRCPERPKCMYCGKRRTWVAFTYFGAPVCGECWDGTWRKTEDGECDPPFEAIKNTERGEWLTAAPAARLEEDA